MKTDIHPTWYPQATVTCSCGNSWTTGATVESIRTDICSQCHPFYTGEQRIIDTEGQVDRFMKRLQIRDSKRAEADEREASRTPANLPLSELDLAKRQLDLLAGAGLNTAGDALALFEEKGDDGVLAIDGIGRKALIDLKRGLRARGYTIAGDTGDNDEE
jgi:large subunit ribosomal protein L31